MSFKEVYGNEAAKKSIQQAILNDRISNAYVIEGMEGVGKKLLARLFARALVCENEETKPCGVCSGCRKAQTKNHPDLIYLKKAVDKASIGVEEVREQILTEIHLRPYLAKRRVFLIGDGDAMSTEAQNALLKVLEEPPSYVTFLICVTKQEKLLDTVLSRSQVISMFPLSKDEITAYLDEKNGENEKHRLFARLSQGSIGTALSLLSDENTEKLFEDSINAVMLLKNQASNIHETTAFFITEKENIQTVIDFCQTFLRDCVFLKTGMDEQVIYENKLSEMRVFLDGIPKKSLVSAFDRLTDFRLRLKQNLNFSASASETVMRIWEDFHDKSSGHQI